jgi:hypothetical protein
MRRNAIPMPRSAAPPVEQVNVATPVEQPPAPGAALPALTTSGELRVAEGAIVRESVLAEGPLHVGARAVIEGSVASLSAADVGEGARIAGAIDVEGPVLWGSGSSVGRASLRGPLVTRGGVVRAASVEARAGIHPADAEGGA